MKVNIEVDEITVPDYAVHDVGNICGFFGEYRFLSNFYPCKVYFKGHFYPSSEHAYQASKWPEDQRGEFLTCTASQSKRMGRKAPNFNKEKWDALKYEVMAAIVFDKFLRNKDLRAKLLVTHGKFLEERNNWNDTYWGTCQGAGQNRLGELLMKIRGFWQ